MGDASKVVGIALNGVGRFSTEDVAPEPFPLGNARELSGKRKSSSESLIC
jgi:hypothetical protein